MPPVYILYLENVLETGTFLQQVSVFWILKQYNILFHSIEINDESIEYAKFNIKLNNWEDSIIIKKPPNKDRIILDVINESNDKMCELCSFFKRSFLTFY